MFFKMVFTRSGRGKIRETGEINKVNHVKRTYTRKNHSPHSAPQLKRSGDRLLFPDLLKHHGQVTIMHSHKGGIKRMARRVIDTSITYNQKVEEEETEELISDECIKNDGRNSNSIQKTQQLQDENLSGSRFQADIQLSVMKNPEAVDLNMHGAFAADLEGTLHQGASATHSDEDMSPSDGNKMLNNTKNNPNEGVVNCYLRSSHHHQSASEKIAHLPVAGVHGNLESIGDDMTFGQRADDVASNNAQEDRVSCGSLRNNNLPTRSLNLTEIAEQMNADDESEVDSLEGESSISVRGYKVKPQYVDPLRSILSKHGDIAVNCDKPVAIRSIYLVYLCEVLEKLKTTNFVAITRNELEEILASLSHIEGECVEVGWLKNRVNLIHEAKLAISVLRPTSDVKQRLIQQKSKVQIIKDQLQVYEKDYAIKRAEIANLEEIIHVSNFQLSLEMEQATDTEKMILDYRAKLRHVFELESLVESLI
ncbi:uncharacterized protein LOC104895084 isoform X1 [Beta vulgaris subsp. vulgaris]|uniref:uncharacterized protein LOC104895084 isoform X1 n=2 Tax=Beta vulgaris subsp. vulgaris TaxID=3555 RepID=UPI00053FB512|nr:uncharacterized protein LOC104895084 isoform X1 [Beta vulgaris subsp. vulgaris]